MRFSDGSLSFIRIKYMYITFSIIYVHEHGGIWGHSAQIEGDGMFFNVSQYSTILFFGFLPRTRSKVCLDGKRKVKQIHLLS